MPIEWTLSVDGKETLTGVGAGCFNAEDPCVRCLRSRNSVYEYLSKTTAFNGNTIATLT